MLRRRRSSSREALRKLREVRPYFTEYKSLSGRKQEKYKKANVKVKKKNEKYSDENRNLKKLNDEQLELIEKLLKNIIEK